jgi:hypothetical protein
LPLAGSFDFADGSKASTAAKIPCTLNSVPG